MRILILTIHFNLRASYICSQVISTTSIIVFLAAPFPAHATTLQERVTFIESTMFTKADAKEMAKHTEDRMDMMAKRAEERMDMMAKRADEKMDRLNFKDINT